MELVILFEGRLVYDNFLMYKFCKSVYVYNFY